VALVHPDKDMSDASVLAGYVAVRMEGGWFMVRWQT
jgi:hypothetical protein